MEMLKSGAGKRSRGNRGRSI